MPEKLIQYPSFGVVTTIFNEKKFIFRCCPIDKRCNAGHYHNDQCSIFIEDLFIDIGSYSYNRGIKDRNYFRYTRNHNVGYIYNLEQNGNLKNTFDLRPFNSTTSCKVSQPDQHMIYINSKLKYNSGEIYRREVLINEEIKKIYITDQFKNIMSNYVGVNFNLHPSLTPKIINKQRINLGNIIIKSNLPLKIGSRFFSPFYDYKEYIKYIYCNTKNYINRPIKFELLFLS